MPDEDKDLKQAKEEKEIPESTEDVEVTKSKLIITDSEGELKAVAKMKQLKKHLSAICLTEKIYLP